MALGTELLRGVAVRRRTEGISVPGLQRFGKRCWLPGVSIRGGGPRPQSGDPNRHRAPEHNGWRGSQIIETDADDLAIEKGLASGSAPSMAWQRSSSNKLASRLNRRSSSINHWCIEDSGSMIRALFGTAGKMEAVQDETGFDGFAQAHFIGQQNAGL